MKTSRKRIQTAGKRLIIENALSCASTAHARPLGCSKLIAPRAIYVDASKTSKDIRGCPSGKLKSDVLLGGLRRPNGELTCSIDETLREFLRVLVPDDEVEEDTG
ncbi:hypothetical protein J6590_089401 [Homalodisca vitripennis]|nr:hypothetical protein J6590_089401 [Homalodisca vitripennis]